MDNLLSNAMKYSGKERPVIEIGCTETAQGRAYFVKDNGIGISTEDQGIVFKMFKRLHAKDAYGGGSGAGLPIVKKIVERHGGMMWIESKVGEGSTFYFTLEETGV